MRIRQVGWVKRSETGATTSGLPLQKSSLLGFALRAPHAPSQLAPFSQTLPQPNLQLLHRPYRLRMGGVLSFLAKVLIKKPGFLSKKHDLVQKSPKKPGFLKPAPTRTIFLLPSSLFLLPSSLFLLPSSLSLLPSSLFLPLRQPFFKFFDLKRRKSEFDFDFLLWFA